MTIWRKRIACWIPKATRTHPPHVKLIAFPLQQWLQERASVLPYMYITHLIITCCTCHSVKKRTNLHPLYIVVVELSHNSSPKWRCTMSRPGDRRTSFSTMALHFKDFSVNHMGLSGFDLSNTWVVALSYTRIKGTGLYPRVAVFRKSFERPILHPRNRSLGRYSQIINSERTPTRDRLKRKKDRIIMRRRIRNVCISFAALVSSLHVVARTVLCFPLFTLPLFFASNSPTLSNYLTQRHS